jgi:hypothetical protein
LLMLFWVMMWWAGTVATAGRRRQRGRGRGRGQRRGWGQQRGRCVTGGLHSRAVGKWETALGGRVLAGGGRRAACVRRLGLAGLPQLLWVRPAVMGAGPSGAGWLGAHMRTRLPTPRRGPGCTWPIACAARSCTSSVAGREEGVGRHRWGCAGQVAKHPPPRPARQGSHLPACQAGPAMPGRHLVTSALLPAPHLSG